jgi:arabinose-5-phosphate isomerase
MLSKLFSDQKKYISHFFDGIDLPRAEQMLQLLQGCAGTLFFTGVGKSGLIAEKVATTMTSTGTRAHYMPPVDALHGDLGSFSSKDVLIVLSKSGESDELLSLIPYVRNKGVTTIAWVSRPNSRLERATDHSMLLPLERELCPFDLAPVTSAAVQLLFGDILAVALMQSKRFTLEDYARNHPAGRIGKRIVMRVRDLMLTDHALPLATPSDTLGSKLVELSDKRCGCLLLTDDQNQLQGIFTDGDLRRALQTHGAAALDKKLSDLMTTSFRSINADALAWDAMQKMEEDQKRPITVLPVLDSGRVLGLIKMHDILQSGL